MKTRHECVRMRDHAFNKPDDGKFMSSEFRDSNRSTQILFVLKCASQHFTLIHIQVCTSHVAKNATDAWFGIRRSWFWFLHPLG